MFTRKKPIGSRQPFRSATEIEGMPLQDLLSDAEIYPAYTHIARLYPLTPIVPYDRFTADGVTVVLWAKLDTLRLTGSFKGRGSEYCVYKAVSSGALVEGSVVVTSSAGNHAKGLIEAARLHNLIPVVFMAEKTPENKVAACRENGAAVVLVEGGYEEASLEAKAFYHTRETTGLMRGQLQPSLLEQIARAEKLEYVPAFEHPDVIMGQGTVASEAMMQLQQEIIFVDFMIAPYGGGGLTNGMAFAARHVHNGEHEPPLVYGAQAYNFNSMAESWRAGKLSGPVSRGETIADGIRVVKPSQRMLELSRHLLAGIEDVTEEQIRNAIVRVSRNKGLAEIQKAPIDELIQYGFTAPHIRLRGRISVVEGAAAAAFALAYSGKIPYGEIAHARKTDELHGVIVASGNNIDAPVWRNIVASNPE